MTSQQEESYRVFGEIVSADKVLDMYEVAFPNGMTATAQYLELAAGGISPEVGSKFEAKADILEPNSKISPYGFMVTGQIA